MEVETNFEGGAVRFVVGAAVGRAVNGAEPETGACVTGAREVGAVDVGAFDVGALVMGALVVGASVVGVLVAGAFVIGALVVGAMIGACVGGSTGAFVGGCTGACVGGSTGAPVGTTPLRMELPFNGNRMVWSSQVNEIPFCRLVQSVVYVPSVHTEQDWQDWSLMVTSQPLFTPVSTT